MKGLAVAVAVLLATSVLAQRPEQDGSECNNGQGVGGGRCGSNNGDGGGNGQANGTQTVCSGWGDPHYWSCDRRYLDYVGGPGLYLWNGKQLLASTCGGDKKQSDFKLWATTKYRGLLTEFNFEFTKLWGSGKKIQFDISFSAASPYLSCKIDGSNFGSDFTACNEEAQKYGVSVRRENPSNYWRIVSQAYGTNFEEFNFRVYHYWYFFYVFTLNMDTGLYGNRMTGLLGNMNGDSADDDNCHRAVGNLIECYEYNNLVNDGFGFENKFSWPRSCPGKDKKAPQGKKRKLSPEEKKKEIRAKQFCRFINNRSGPYKGCGSAEQLDVYRLSCIEDFISVDEEVACASAQMAAEECHLKTGKTVDLQKTSCA